MLRRGTRIRSGSGRFDLKFVAKDPGIARLGCVVPKRLTPLAVRRNRLKRVIREAFRVCRDRLPDGDIVVRQIAKVTDPYELELSQEIKELFARLAYGERAV
ncbi:MAG: ribonuclease P protein component [Burkholderiales bacterium]